MPESNQEGYRTLGWILNQSEQGIYLVIADEAAQKEIVDLYRQGTVGIYDCRQRPGEYSFHELQEWAAGFAETKRFMIAYFHLAVQTQESLKRLNFSRDMIEGLGKNIIFLVTPFWDDRLAQGAYDFYSFVKLRIPFHSYERKKRKDGSPLLAGDKHKEAECGSEELKQKLADAYVLVERAKNEILQARYDEGERLLLSVRRIKEKALGANHLETAEIEYELAELYERQGRYKEAEEMHEKALRIREKALGEGHPDTAASYNNLAWVYQVQGRYEKAISYFEKAYKIFVSLLGKNHPNTEIVYGNMKTAYAEWKPEGDFQKWLEEKTRDLAQVGNAEGK